MQQAVARDGEPLQEKAAVFGVVHRVQARGDNSIDGARRTQNGAELLQVFTIIGWVIPACSPSWASAGFGGETMQPERRAH